MDKRTMLEFDTIYQQYRERFGGAPYIGIPDELLPLLLQLMKDCQKGKRKWPIEYAGLGIDTSDGKLA